MHKVKQHKGVAVAAAVCAVAMPARPGTGVIDWLALSSDWRYQLAGVIDEPALSISQHYRPALKHAVPTARVSPAHPNPHAHAAHAPDSTQARNAAPLKRRVTLTRTVRHINGDAVLSGGNQHHVTLRRIGIPGDIAKQFPQKNRRQTLCLSYSAHRCPQRQ